MIKSSILKILNSLTKIDVLLILLLLISDHHVDFLLLVVLGHDLASNLSDSSILLFISGGSFEDLGDNGTIFVTGVGGELNLDLGIGLIARVGGESRFDHGAVELCFGLS
jgi:hypothetical protein